MERQQIEEFLAETRKAFHFLEQEHGYRWLDEEIKYLDYWRDIVAQSRYISSRVGVEVWWAPADAALGVTFVEVQQTGVFPRFSTLYPSIDTTASKAILLSSLAEMQGMLDDPDFLLKEVDNFRTHTRRKTILLEKIWM